MVCRALDLLTEDSNKTVDLRNFTRAFLQVNRNFRSLKVGKNLNLKITEANMLLFHKFNITPSMKACKSRLNVQMGAKHILDEL
jgi:hypothetical protein